MFFGKRLFLSLCFVLLALALVFGGRASATIHDISIIDFDFVPDSKSIQRGDSVRWTNDGAVQHTSTSDVAIWDSGTLNPGQSFIFEFTTTGSFPYSCTFHPSTMTATILVQSVDVRDETGNREKPSEFTLSQNYPNPFNQATRIEFTLAKSGFVSLNIYDILGRKVKTLVSENVSSGHKSALWDGKNEEEKEVASGIYFYRLNAGDLTETKKMLLLQ
jgi:plastocyanin